MPLARGMAAMETALVRNISAVTRRRLATVLADAPLPDAARLLSVTPISLVIVCGADGTMAGVITKTDVVCAFGHHAGAASAMTSAQVMTREVVFCRSEDRLEDVLHTMGEHSLVHIPVLEAGSRPIGVMEARDALRALVARASHEIWHLRDYIMGVGYR
jgi:CBS domain-containing protein